MKEEMQFIEQLNNSQIFKECLEPLYCLVIVVYFTCGGADRAALSKLLGRLFALQFFSSGTFESVALNISRFTLTHDTVHWAEWTNYRMPRGAI
jgi:hypothetical protein